MADVKTKPIRLILAWLVVAIPLGWGVVQTLAKSLPLFRTSAPSDSSAQGRGH